MFDVRDMIVAYVLAADRARPGETYNVATGRPVSIASIAHHLAKASLVPIRIQGGHGPATIMSGNPAKFRRATGWRPTLPLRRTLIDVLESERRRQS